MSDTTTRSVWEFLELPHDCPETHDLYSWGLNCDRESNPFLVFLDIIGWSDETYGEKFVLGQWNRSLGYIEQDHLGRALMEHSLNPRTVEKWLDALMQCEDV